jgi:hypothetical protein
MCEAVVFASASIIHSFADSLEMRKTADNTAENILKSFFQGR